MTRAGCGDDDAVVVPESCTVCFPLLSLYLSLTLSRPLRNSLSWFFSRLGTVALTPALIHSPPFA